MFAVGYWFLPAQTKYFESYNEFFTWKEVVLYA